MAISVELRAIFLLVLFGAIVWHRIGLYFEERSQREALRQWLTDNDLLEYEASLHKFGREHFLICKFFIITVSYTHCSVISRLNYF